MKIIYLILIFAFMCHMSTGVRFLFLDVHKGIEIKTAKKTAGLALLIGLIFTVVFGVMIW